MTGKKLFKALTNRGKTIWTKYRVQLERENSRRQFVQLGNHLLQDLGLNERGFLPKKTAQPKAESTIKLGFPTNASELKKVYGVCCPGDGITGKHG
jgi:hypothetical protein